MTDWRSHVAKGEAGRGGTARVASAGLGRGSVKMVAIVRAGPAGVGVATVVGVFEGIALAVVTAEDSTVGV